MFNVVDYLFIRDSLRNGELDGGLEKMRGAVASVYDRDYYTTQDLYGETNDNDDFGTEAEDGEEERVDSPFAVTQFNPKRTMRPSSHTYTPQDDTGFAGLEPPVG